MHTKQRLITIAGVSLLFSLSFLSAATLEVPEQHSTIAAAIISAKKGDTIVVSPGIYHEQIFISPEVTLLSRSLFKAQINGSGRGTAVTLGNNATISGFDIRNATIGVFTTAGGVSIIQCRITNNQQTGITCVGNLPRIEDNIIVYNKSSGIQGWDVRTTSSSINHNTIAFNGNHGISVGGNSSIIVENNLIVFNSQFGLKPAEESVRVQMLNNIFYQNAKFTDVLPVGNFSLNPQFINAPQMNFQLDPNSKCIGRGSDNLNVGSRIVY